MQNVGTTIAMTVTLLLASAALTACDTSDPLEPAENAQPRMGSNDAVGGEYLTPAEKKARELAAAEESRRNDRLAEDRAQAAVAILHPTKGQDVSGLVTFSQSNLGIQVVAEVEGLSEGLHAMHIHIYGDCTAPDASSAGTHFNFQGSSLDPPPDINRITGNLGELKTDAQGAATLRDILPEVRITGPKSIIGRAVIVHEKGNDMSQPPMGATGARLACGVIGIANPGDGMGGMNMDMQEPMDSADMPGEKADDMDDTTDAGSEEAADDEQTMD